MKRLTIVSVLFASLSVLAQPIAYPGGYSVPVSGTVQWDQVQPRTRLRKRQIMLLGVRRGQSLEFVLTGVQVGRYTDTIAFRVLDTEGVTIREGTIEADEVRDVVVKDVKAGVYRLEIDTRGNAVEVLPAVDAASFVASRNHPLGIVYQAPPLYFWVPQGSRSFAVRVRGQGEREHVAYSVHDAAGMQVARGTTHDGNGTQTVEVKKGANGAWNIQIRKLNDYTFEDVSLSLEGDVCGMVSEDPAALLQPMMMPFAQAVDERVTLGVRFFASAEQLQGCSVQLDATDLQNGETLFRKTQRHFPPMTLAAETAADGFLHARLTAVLRDRTGNVNAREEYVVGVAHGEMFREKAYEETHGRAPVSLADQQAGFQVFARGEPGNLRPTAYPAEEELVSTVRRRVARGEFETIYIALYPLEDLNDVTVSVSPFEDGAGASLNAGAAIRWVRCWPQRTDWRSKVFHVIPELLEPRNRGALREGRTQPLAVSLHVPKAAAPGLYTADVSVSCGNAASVRAATLAIEVLPFELARPDGIVWGLYPDSRRWDTMPESQIEAEMIDFREHGITSLMLYPQWTADWTWKEGTLTADFQAFRTRMRLYDKVGLGGPMVISLQSAEHMLRRLTGSESTSDSTVIDAYGQMLALIRQEARQGGWPEFCLHSVDEPHGGPKLEAALRTLRMIKQAGFKTFNTCYGKAVRETLDPYLDYRCYNNIGFLSFPSQEAADELRRETVAAGDVFWWYGTGCYTNRSFIQDGNVIANRFMAGYHFWRTKASGCWSWTFLRPKGDAYDDFDGQSQREYKDACIAYPTRDGTGLVSTLQWEGLREGIDDYKYLYTLSKRIRIAMEDASPRTRRLGAELKQEMERRLGAMPWTCRDDAFTNGDADALRSRIQDMILALDNE